MVAIIPAESAGKTIPDKNITFRWTYIAVPVVILIISIILTAFFYRLLPPEVAYHFTDGSPDQWMDRIAITAWLLIPQFIFVFIGLAMSGGTTLLTRHSLQADTGQLSKALTIMGNMVALPQIILTFAMLDIFLYNAYQIHLMPLWIFVVIVMVLGVIILGIFFIHTVRQFRGQSGKSLQE